jgi:hypothetical protein
VELSTSDMAPKCKKLLHCEMDAYHARELPYKKYCIYQIKLRTFAVESMRLL